MLEAIAGSAFTLALGGWLFALHLWREIEDLKISYRHLYQDQHKTEQRLDKVEAEKADVE